MPNAPYDPQEDIKKEREIEIEGRQQLPDVRITRLTPI